MPVCYECEEAQTRCGHLELVPESHCESAVIMVPSRLKMAAIIVPDHPRIACFRGVQSSRRRREVDVVRAMGDVGVLPDIRPVRRRCQALPISTPDT